MSEHSSPPRFTVGDTVVVASKDPWNGREIRVTEVLSGRRYCASDGWDDQVFPEDELSPAPAHRKVRRPA